MWLARCVLGLYNLRGATRDPGRRGFRDVTGDPAIHSQRPKHRTGPSPTTPIVWAVTFQIRGFSNRVLDSEHADFLRICEIPSLLIQTRGGLGVSTNLLEGSPTESGYSVFEIWMGAVQSSKCGCGQYIVQYLDLDRDALPWVTRIQSLGSEMLRCRFRGSVLPPSSEGWRNYFRGMVLKSQAMCYRHGSRVFLQEQSSRTRNLSCGAITNGNTCGRPEAYSMQISFANARF